MNQSLYLESNNETKRNPLLPATLYFVSSLILYFLVSYIGSFSFLIKLITGSLLYFFIVYFFLKAAGSVSRPYRLVILILPAIFSFFYFNILKFEQTWVSMPSNLFILIGIFFGWLASKKTVYYYIFFLVALLFTWQKVGADLLKNKMQYNSYTQEVGFSSPLLNLYDSLGHWIDLVKDKRIIILDFWHSRCGACYKLFADINNVSEKIDSLKYNLAVVNIPVLNENKFSNFRLLNKFGYSFQKFFAGSRDIIDQLDIKVFPTTVIISNNQVIYRGDFFSAIKFLNL